jgi:hypothetical protein
MTMNRRDFMQLLGALGAAAAAAEGWTEPKDTLAELRVSSGWAVRPESLSIIAERTPVFGFRVDELFVNIFGKTIVAMGSSDRVYGADAWMIARWRQPYTPEAGLPYEVGQVIPMDMRQKHPTMGCLAPKDLRVEVHHLQPIIIGTGIPGGPFGELHRAIQREPDTWSWGDCSMWPEAKAMS